MSYPEYNIGEKKERKNPAKASVPLQGLFLIN
jgi:hypothetical protein